MSKPVIAVLFALCLLTPVSALAQQLQPVAYGSAPGASGDLTGLRPGVSTDQDALAVFGPTNAITTRSDGTEVLQWRVPDRAQMLGLEFGPDRRLIGLWQGPPAG